MIYTQNKLATPGDITVCGAVWVILCNFKDVGWAVFDRGQKFFDSYEEAKETMESLLHEFTYEEMCFRKVELGQNHIDFYLDGSVIKKK